MLKVYVSGFERPYAVVGTYLHEDERYLTLQDGGIKRKIPHEKIVHIEDLSALVSAANPDIYGASTEQIAVKLPEANLSLTSVVSPDAAKDSGSFAADKSLFSQPLDDDKLVRVIRDRFKNSSNKDSPEELLAPAKKKSITIVVSGVVQDSFEIEVNDSLFASSYTPYLAKEVSMHPEIKRIMDNGIIFNGLPKIIGDSIYIETAKISDKLSGAAKSISLAGKAADAMARFKRPEREFNQEFSMLGKTNFAINKSPFDGPVPLSDDDDDDDSEANQEYSDDSSGEEEDAI